MSERLTSEEIEHWREELPAWHNAMPLHVIRIAEHMLALHDERERLRNLQQQDVTEEQRLHWLHSWEISSGPKLHCDMIAAAVRVMLADHFVDANKKDDTHANS